MVIKKIEIEGFGKFTDTVFDFENGLNLIYGNNEDGKTTIMSFVKMMFYSSSSKTEKAADLFKTLRKKYRPWSGGPMAGAIEFETDGLTYRLQKEFLKSEASDKTTVFCITTGENIQIENKNDAGEHFFGMNLEEFERSIFIGQSGGFTADNAGDSLAMRISNLSVSGNENISQDLILKRLSDAAEELVSKSRKKGLLVEAEIKLEDLKLEKQELLQLEESQKETEAEIAQLITEINTLEAELNALSDFEKLENAKKDLNAFYTLQNKLNLLKALKGQLSAYDATYEDMEKYIDAAKELNSKIEGNLSRIQEATLCKDNTISDEEYSRLCRLDQKCSDIRKDLELIRGHITELWTELEARTRAALKGAKVGALSILAVSIILAAIAFLALPFGAFIGLGAVILGMGLFSALFFTAGKRIPSKLAIQLIKRDYEGAIRNLSVFEEDFTQKSPFELASALNSQLADIMSALSDGLGAYGIDSIEQLKAKSGKSREESIKAITDELAVQKEAFITLSCTIKHCAGFSAAKILYVELCESLTKLKSIQQEIKTTSLATGIENTKDEFVADKIKALGEFIQDAPILPADSNSSIPQIRIVLNEKRERLNQLQLRIKRPERGMSELLKELDSAGSYVNQLRQRLDEINIAMDVMNEAILDTNKGLGSHLSNKVGKYLAEITDGKYTDVLVPRDLSLETRSTQGQPFHEWKYLSTGAIDKIYLALRLAMTDVLAEKHEVLPLFFDDILSQYDDAACETALKFLKKYLDTSGSVSQIIFFTCHKNIFDLAKNIFDDANELHITGKKVE